MVQSSADVMGVRIAEARGRASLTQAQLAATTSLDRSALAKIENGSRRVSALELARIADAVGERIEWFVTDPAPAIVSHRNTMDPGTTSPKIDQLIERATRNVDFLVDHDKQLAVPELPRLRAPSTVDDAERSAVDARQYLGFDTRQPATGLAEAAAAGGIFTFTFELGKDSADAASILLRRGAVAVVNGSLHVGRRRLALAHEIGHCLVADEYTIDWNTVDHADGDLRESRLDRFARALLLPSDELPRRWEELRGRDDTRTAAVKLASSFRVDMSTLARRLSEIGQITSGEAQKVRDARTTRADILELNLVVSHEITAPSMPGNYEQSVLRLYRADKISAARATDLLFDVWGEDDLPVLPAAHEKTIWQLTD